MPAELRFALRALLKTPGFTAVAITTLGLAIGVNSTLFSLIYALTLRPVIPDRPDEVVCLYTAGKGAKRDYRPFSHAEFEALRRNRGDAFAEVAAISSSIAAVGRGESMRRREVHLVSEGFFRLMGVSPALGRFFTEAESQPHAGARVVVAGYRFWQAMGGEPGFVGSTLRINGELFTVIGVTPKDFSGISVLFAPDLWFPLGAYAHVGSADDHVHVAADLADPSHFALNLFARLPRGRDLAALQSRLPDLGAQLAAVQPAGPALERELQAAAPWRMGVETRPSDNDLGVPSVLFLALTAAVLAIACVNLANMFLARVAARHHETAVRLALGAARWRIVRQALIEAALVAAAGGALGLLLSVWAGDVMLAAFSGLLDEVNFSLALQLQPDPAVIAATLLLCGLATLLFGCGPALAAARIDLLPHLSRTAAAHGTGSWSRFFAPRQCLVIAQIALSLALLHTAGLFTRSAARAATVNLGFEPAGVVVGELDYSLELTAPAHEINSRLSAVLDRVTGMPATQRAAFATTLAFDHHETRRRVAPAGTDALQPDPALPPPGESSLFSAVTHGYFETIGVRLLRGRDFSAAEARDAQAPRVAILDETLAAKLFPARDPLGAHIRFLPAQPGDPADGIEIVGIVRAHRHDTRDRVSLPPRVFVPLAQADARNVFLHVQTAARNADAISNLLPSIRATIAGADPNAPLLRLMPFGEIIDRTIPVWLLRFGAALSAVLGGIAFVLAVVGVYGVKAFVTQRRTREIGIRLALGARRTDVMRLLLGQSLGQLAVGLALGLLLALALGRALAFMLYQVGGFDAWSLLGSVLLVIVAGGLATWIPARLATRADPVDALRAE